MSVERKQETAPTRQTWMGKHGNNYWTVTVEHSGPVDGFSHGHRRIASCLNHELTLLDGTDHSLPVVQMQRAHGVKLHHTQENKMDPHEYSYSFPRSEGGPRVVLETGREAQAITRARILVACLRDDESPAHPRLLRSRGLDVSGDWGVR